MSLHSIIIKSAARCPIPNVALSRTKMSKGLLFLGCGPSSVRLCPPLVVTKDEADVAMDVLEECIVQVAK